MLHIKIIMRRNKNYAGTFLLRHPLGIACPDVAAFSFIVFGKNYSMTSFRIAENGKRLSPVFRMIKTFDRSIEIIKVGMKNDSFVQNIASCYKRVFCIYYSTFVCVCTGEIFIS